MRLGRRFICPTYADDQEPGEPEAVIPDDDGKVPPARRRRMLRGPVAAFDLVARPPAPVSLLAALGGDATLEVIEAGHDAAVADVLAWVEDEAVVVYSGPAGTKWERPVGGLAVARFRHWDCRHRMPLLHGHLVVSVKGLRADGKWGHLDSRRQYAHVVAAGAPYNQRVLEEVCDRLGLATQPRIPTPGLRPVMELAGMPPELIDWSATRQRDTVRRGGRRRAAGRRPVAGEWAAPGRRRCSRPQAGSIVRLIPRWSASRSCARCPPTIDLDRLPRDLDRSQPCRRCG
ncbi:conjugative relaxase domain-containing protein, TrwC/TraI family [Actinacidiphila yanglinensis]|uniref:Conjugative relaxase domain-containing protein, TrwC/TraI family n=1 Tax=Actinacidiphila yanglinensis TaxID=310779 RepID=A0A1H6DJI6_9ACTN|nr:MobF family relaxase [Actinacidiphila yanglinensis]SEG85301.1 conjugative relaxase domain-containing protein, TrwC/TraI family [Actinacidiphila yanglinensis]SEG91109.1 conjugative relaxase domain-containing protein, TrwC/TraI family [Actinacidiphila yanglinensis]